MHAVTRRVAQRILPWIDEAGRIQKPQRMRATSAVGKCHPSIPLTTTAVLSMSTVTQMIHEVAPDLIVTPTLVTVTIITATQGPGVAPTTPGPEATTGMILIRATPMRTTTGQGPGRTQGVGGVAVLAPMIEATAGGRTRGHTAEVTPGPTPGPGADQGLTEVAPGVGLEVTGGSSTLVLTSSLALSCLKKSPNLQGKLMFNPRLLIRRI